MQLASLWRGRHAARHGLGQEEGAARVHVEAAVVALLAHVEQVTALQHRHTGVVDEAVDLAEAAVHGVEQVRVRGDVADVAVEGLAAAADFFDVGQDGFEALGIAPCDRREVGAFLCECECEGRGPSDAARRAGDDGCALHGSHPFSSLRAMITRWIWLEVCATAASAAKHLAMEAAAVASVPASSLCAAERTSRRAASVSFAMSASMNWMPWNSAIAWPNCLRILACSTDASSAACRMPTASDAMPTRPFSSTLIIMWKPLPCVPSRASAGNATFSKCSSPTCEERWPSLCSFGPRDTPADAQSTMKMLMPRLPASGSVRASTKATSATGAL